MMVTMTLTEFLTARIAEDEAIAREAAKVTVNPEWRAWHGRGSRSTVRGADHTEGLAVECNRWTAPHVARHDPARVLRECEAKRRIVTEYAARDDDTDLMLGVTGDALRQRRWSGLRLAVQFLASVYADHPDYRQEWKS